MSDAGARILATRASDCFFLRDKWQWSSGLAYLLDVDTDSPNDSWRAWARDLGETWEKRRDAAMRAIELAAGRTRQPLVRTTLYPLLPVRQRNLIETPVRVLSTVSHGERYVWTDLEDFRTKAQPNVQSATPRE